MAYLKNLSNGRIISKYVNFNKSQEINLTVQTFSQNSSTICLTMSMKHIIIYYVFL